MEVLKDGQPFKSRETIHAGDAMDLSFEAGYPDYRWIANAALQIYDREEFNSGKSREIVLVNDSSQVIKHLKIYSVDKFFLFDFEPGKEMHLSALPPKGDFAFVWLEGEFHSGDRFSSSAATMLQVGQSVPVFRIFVSDHGVRIEH